MKKGFLALEFVCFSIILTIFITTSFSIMYYIFWIVKVNLIIDKNISYDLSINKLSLEDNKYRIIYSENLTQQIKQIDINIKEEFNKYLNINCSSISLYDSNNFIAGLNNSNCLTVNNKNINKYYLAYSVISDFPDFISKNLEIIGLNSKIKIDKYYKIRREYNL